jgi:hypothetical protein
MAPKKDTPSPKTLLLEARGVVEQDAPIDLDDYADVIGELRQKNFSFGKIAEWLGERLGRPINKGAVFRAYKEWEFTRSVEIAENAAEESIMTKADRYNEMTGRLADYLVNAANEYSKTQGFPSIIIGAGIRLADMKFEQFKADEESANAEDSVKQETITEDKKS